MAAIVMKAIIAVKIRKKKDQREVAGVIVTMRKAVTVELAKFTKDSEMIQRLIASFQKWD